MGLISVSAPRARPSKESTMDKIAKAVEIAGGVLGVGLAVPKYLQEREEKQATIDKMTFESEPLTQEERNLYIENGVPKTSAPRTREQAMEWDKRMFETPQAKASRERNELMLNLLTSKEKREKEAHEKDMTKPTVGEEARDRKVATSLAEYADLGGSATSEKNLNQLELALNELRSGKDISGGILSGWAPKPLRKLMRPEAVQAQDLIEQTILDSLRPILGAQFTENEGKRVIEKTFDPQLPEEQNLLRGEMLLNSLKMMKKIKEAAFKYFDAQGSMKGYRGITPNIQRAEDLMQYSGITPVKSDGKTQMIDIDGDGRISEAEKWLSQNPGDPRATSVRQAINIRTGK